MYLFVGTIWNSLLLIFFSIISVRLVSAQMQVTRAYPGGAWELVCGSGPDAPPCDPIPTSVDAGNCLPPTTVTVTITGTAPTSEGDILTGVPITDSGYGTAQCNTVSLTVICSTVTGGSVVTLTETMTVATMQPDVTVTEISFTTPITTQLIITDGCVSTTITTVDGGIASELVTEFTTVTVYTGPPASTITTTILVPTPIDPPPGEYF